MSENLSQCLLFIVHKADKENSRESRSSSARRLQSCSAVALPAVESFALFSDAFKEKRPEVLERFKEKSIQTVTSQNVSSLQLSRIKKLDIYELLIDESPSVNWDRLYCVTDVPNREFIYLLFPSATVSNEYKHSLKHIRPAIDDGNLDVIRHLLTHKVYMDCKCQGESLLHLAAKRSSESFVSLLLEHKAGIEVRRDDFATPLLLAVNSDCSPIVQLLLGNGANLQAQMRDGRNSLHLAAENGSVSMVRFLIKSGITVDSTGKCGYTALCLAARKGLLDVSEMLLHHGADLNSKLSDGSTPILAAAWNGHIELVKLLVIYGAEVSSRSRDNRSVLSGTWDAKSPDVFHYLLENYFLDLELLKETCIVNEFVEFIDYLRRWWPYGYTNFRNRCKVLACHVVKITVLRLLHNVIGEVDASALWSDTMPMTLSVFKSQCEEEVSRLKSETVGDSHLSFYSFLTEDVSKVACYLRNDSVAQIVAYDELEGKFPIYGSILMHHLKKGVEKKLMIEEGIKICNLLFCDYKRLPYEIKERILCYLRMKDFWIFKKACGHLIKSGT